MNRNIDLYGVPMDLGADRRGVDMGPSALRIAGVVPRVRGLGHEIDDRGNISVSAMELSEVCDKTRKYEREIVDCCHRLEEAVAGTVREGRFPLVLGGDHSIAVGTVTGIAKVYRERSEKVGLIWFDAHGDMNTPDSSPSGNIHGMPLSALLGYGAEPLVGLGDFSPKVDPANVALIGIRSLDLWERDLVKKSGAHVYTMKEVDRLGMAEVIDRAIRWVTDGTSGFHLSFDLDGLDPQVAPGVGTAERGGINYREAHLLMELVADSQKLLGLEMVELNPILDRQNETAEVAVGLIQSALGRRIL